MHLIRPVAMGPVLSEADIQPAAWHEQAHQKLNRLTQTSDEIILQLDEVAGASRDLVDNLKNLEGTLEAYEESIPGHHPVHKESIRDE